MSFRQACVSQEIVGLAGNGIGDGLVRQLTGGCLAGYFAGVPLSGYPGDRYVRKYLVALTRSGDGWLARGA